MLSMDSIRKNTESGIRRILPELDGLVSPYPRRTQQDERSHVLASMPSVYGFNALRKNGCCFGERTKHTHYDQDWIISHKLSPFPLTELLSKGTRAHLESENDGNCLLIVHSVFTVRTTGMIQIQAIFSSCVSYSRYTV